jgi:hypothetical protein
VCKGESVREPRYTITLQVLSGDPAGTLIATRDRWKGIAIAVPRHQIEDVRKDREELNKPGVYMLSGQGRLYVGEADEVGHRLSQHKRGKDWWDRAVVFVSATDEFSKGHIRHMEAELVGSLQRVGGVNLDNKNTPARRPLSESARVSADGFLRAMVDLLPFLGFHHLSSDQNSRTVDTESVSYVGGMPGEAVATAGTESPQQGEYSMTSRAGNAALTRVADNEYLVHKGSWAVGEESPKFSKYRPSESAMRRELIESEVLVRKGDHRAFTRDQLFTSMGKAASVICGVNMGAAVWNVERGTPGDGARHVHGNESEPAGVRPPGEVISGAKAELAQPHEYSMTSSAGKATLTKLADKEYLVHKGSRAVGEERPGFAPNRPNAFAKRRELVESEILVRKGDHRVFAEDHLFTSMSVAASVVRGSNASSSEWTTETGTDRGVHDRQS